MKLINKSYIKSEMKRALKSKNSLITFILLLILLAMGVIGIGDGTNGYLESFQYALDGVSAYIFIFLPLLATIPFATSYIDEKKSNMKSYKAIKMGNLGYLINKIIVNFIVAFIVISSASLIIFFIGFLLHKGIAGTMLGIDKWGWMQDDYTFLYIIIQISYVAFLGISFSQLGLAIAAITKNKIITIIGPFVLYILMILTVPYWLNPQLIADFARSSEIGILFRTILALGIFIPSTILFIIFDSKEGIFKYDK
ncbi:MAG: hypothetical protein ACRDD2_06700 [Sarcina sp.]